MNQGGVVTAKKSGKTNITVTVKTNAGNEYAASFEITIKEYPEGVKVYKGSEVVTSVALEKSAKQSVSAKLYYETNNSAYQLDSAKNYTWTSKDEAVATVSDSGVITAVEAGSTTITVVVETNEGRTYTQTITVTVTATETAEDQER